MFGQSRLADSYNLTNNASANQYHFENLVIDMSGAVIASGSLSDYGDYIDDENPNMDMGYFGYQVGK